MAKTNLPLSYSKSQICSVSSCGRLTVARGMCALHHTRWLKHGDSSIVKHRQGSGATPEERFWSRVDKTETCWLWRGAVRKDGYGQVQFRKRGWATHRLSWFLTYGDDPSAYLLHSCDNKICVNPAHLRPGTHQDNMNDMVERERQAHGSQLPQAKLKESDIGQIQMLLKAGVFQRDIAKQFGISQSAVSLIKHGKRWVVIHRSQAPAEDKHWYEWWR